MNISGGGVKLNAKNSSFDYLGMQFRLHRRLAMSIGLMPFSNVGYTVSDTQTATDHATGNTTAYARNYTGDGGLHQLYVGLGVKAVSYTHLDVYKRQGWSWACFVPAHKPVLWDILLHP